MRKAEVLLAYLALAPGLRHPRERLINLLWSDRSDEQARNSLRQCLSSIRKALGDAADLILQVERSTVSLKSELVEIDAHEFERLALEGDFESLSTAVSLYQGEFLEGISIRDPACQEWLESERSRFKRQYIELLSNLAETQLVTHDFKHATQSAEKLVEQDPLVESGWRLLMRSYYENGHRNHALKAYQRCEQVLREELAIEPEAETVSLREKIVGGSVEAGPQTKTNLPVAPQRDSAVYSIVVLPFDNLSGDPEQEYFSDGITESVILNLSLFPGLQVKSRNSSFAFKQQIKSIGEISNELDVDYVVEGSIRKFEARIRITVQLIEAASGNQVWGKRYDAEIENLFDLEEHLSRTIAATVTGQIESDLQRIALAKGASDLQAYDLLLAGIYHCHRFNHKDMVIAIDRLNRCLALDPDNLRAHTTLCYCHTMSWLERWVPRSERSLEQARQHVQRALEQAPEMSFVQLAHADWLTFSNRIPEAEGYVNQVLQANPNDAEALAMKALHLEFKGDFEGALQTAELAYQLDPYHPWNQWNIAESQYLCGQFEASLDTIARIGDVPGFIRVYTVAANVKIGRMTEAREALQTFLQECRESMAEVPQSVDEWLRFSRDYAPFVDSGINQDQIDCLLAAGLEEALEKDSGDDESPIPSVLVLPFENMGGDPEQEYLSDGITESVILKLSSFNGLEVKSRHASFAYKHSVKSIDEIAGELRVNYVVEGSIRKFGERIRITVGLGEISSSNQIWGKRYDSELSDLLDLEDELSLTIAGTVVGHIDKDAQRAALRKPAKDLQSYDYLMRGAYHLEQFAGDDINLAIDLFGKCLALDPDNAQAHARLGIAHMLALYENCSQDRKLSTELMDRHMRRALDLDPNNAEAHAFMAERLMYASDFDKALIHARKAVELNPTLADGYSMMAWHAGATRQIDKALEYADKSMQIDMHHPYAGWNAGEIYRISGDYEKAIETFRSMGHISVSVHGQIAACFAGLNRIEEANREMQVFLEMANAQMATVPATREAWYDLWFETMPYKYKEDNDAFFDLLLKAGLCDHLESATDIMPSILVLPFENMSGDSEQEYFSDGITTSIVISLGMFRGMLVKSQQTSFAYKDSGKSSEEIAAELSVDYLVEGGIRKAGDQIRVSAQLIESASGNQLWGKQYDASLEDLLDLEQELSQTIAATISGRIGHSLQQSAVRKPAKSLESFDYLMRGLYHFGKFTASDLVTATREIGKCLEIDPDNATAHANLGMIHAVNLLEGWSKDLDYSRKRANEHLDKALDLEPENAFAQAYAAENLLTQRQFQESEYHANRAIELNPNAIEGYTVKTDLLVCTNRIDEAVELADRCMQLDPHSVGAGWVAGAAYRNAGMYEKAIKTFRSISHPPDSIHALVAACFIGMGLIDEARREMERFREKSRLHMTNYPDSEKAWREFWLRYVFYQHDEDFNRLFDALLEAGLCDDLENESKEAPAIAVLPFKNMSGDPEQEHFADGLTSDIIATLSRFKHIRTVAHYSMMLYKHQKSSITEIAEQQQVRYILEGSVRKSGERIRVNAALIDSQTDEACWSERYDRDIDDLFALQDEITQQIALALKVELDDGDMARLRSKGTSNVRAWEMVMTAVDLQDTYIRDNTLRAQALLQQAIELDPNYAYAWVALGWTHFQEAFTGYCQSIEHSIQAADSALERARAIDPDYTEILGLAGMIHMMRHEADGAVTCCREAVAREPGNPEMHGFLSYALLFCGDYAEARIHNQKMIELCPIPANWYYMIGAQIECMTDNLEAAAKLYRKGIDVEPESPLCRFFLVDVLLRLGDENGANRLVEEIRALDYEMRGKGLVHSYSNDPALRDALRMNLKKFDLY